MNVLVYTMGKVGSTTVMRALQSVGHAAGRGYAGNIQSLDLDFYDAFVTMVRDPVARNIAQMFETEMAESVDSPTPLTWFSDWLSPILGINVYGSKFPKSKGWKIYDDRLLVIKTEKLTEALADALTELCGPNEYVVEHRATGLLKFGPDYIKYLNEAKFDPEFLDQMYDTKYMKHFYLVKEIDAFKKRWSE